MNAKSSIVVDLDDGSPTMSNDQLEFQDIPHTGPMEHRAVKGTQQTHTFTDFPRTLDSDDDDRQEQLLEGKKKQPSFWTFEYYQSFFDIDTAQVLQRTVRSMVPHPKANYLQTHIRSKPDLYGPFWICVTLVFTTAIAGNITNYITLQDYEKQYEWKYEFHKVTFATTAIFGYWWLIPTALYGLLWWRSNKASLLTYTELLCLYGYSLAIYIPISILWMIPVNWLQWLLVLAGMALSGSVLVLSIIPAFKEDKKAVVIGVLVFIVAMHGLLAVGFMLYFFHAPSVNALPLGSTLAFNSTTVSLQPTETSSIVSVSSTTPATL